VFPKEMEPPGKFVEIHAPLIYTPGIKNQTGGPRVRD
jgi:hypothetical protein